MSAQVLKTKVRGFDSVALPSLNTLRTPRGAETGEPSVSILIDWRANPGWSMTTLTQMARLNPRRVNRPSASLTAGLGHTLGMASVGPENVRASGVPASDA